MLDCLMAECVECEESKYVVKIVDNEIEGTNCFSHYTCNRCSSLYQIFFYTTNLLQKFWNYFNLIDFLCSGNNNNNSCFPYHAEAKIAISCLIKEGSHIMCRTKKLSIFYAGAKNAPPYYAWAKNMLFYIEAKTLTILYAWTKNAFLHYKH